MIGRQLGADRTKVGPGTVSRAGPPSIRDARELVRRGRRIREPIELLRWDPEAAEKGETTAYAKAYARFGLFGA